MPVEVENIEIITHGELPESVIGYARERIAALGEHAPSAIVHARIGLTHQPGSAITRPVRGQANLTIDGRFVRAQVAAANGREAVDLLVDRLRHRLLWLRQRWELPPDREPKGEPHEWRHGSEPAQRPPFYPRPVEERQIVAHKSFTPPRISPREAAWEMDQMDYDFHLFTEAATGRDAVVYRAGPTGYRLARVAPESGSLADPGVPMTLSPHPAPRLTVDQARTRLEATGLPFIFFVDAAAGRGSILYHRYDGHYGLITPAA